jgi:hypothetical protein
MAAKEQGAVRIGREYAVHPVVVTNGCFHPKLIILEPQDGGPIHALVGSWNLTFGGWSANLECVDHLDTDRTPEAMEGLADFFATLASTRRCEHGVRTHCSDLAGRIFAQVGNRGGGSKIRVLHSLSGTIAGQVVAAANELGGATGLTCVSPYWDSAATDRIARELGLDSYSAHVPMRAITAPGALDWPRASKMAKPVRVTALANDDHGGRDLHAKLLEVLCRDGRLVLGGSANATGAGLYATGDGGNVEVCTLRIQRSKASAWKVKAAKKPPMPAQSDTEEDTPDDAGVLIAKHVTDGVEGRILTPWNSKGATVTLLIGRRVADLGEITITRDRRFAIPLDLLGDDALSLEGRVQLRLRDGSAAAEGFITAPDFKALRRRAGTALSAMLAALKQMQTPEDVLAILEFFHANPGELKSRHPFAARSPGSGTVAHDPLVIASSIGRSVGPHQDNEIDDNTEELRTQLAWQRLVERLMAAIARTRPPREDAEDEENKTEQKRRKRDQQSLDKIGLRFPGIFQAWTKKVEDDASYLGILRLTHFVCVTTGHVASATFVNRLVQIALQGEFGPAVRQSAGWCALYIAARVEDPMEIAAARSRLAALGLAADDLDPAFQLQGLLEVISPGCDIEHVLEGVRSCRTVHEEIRSLEAALAEGTFPASLPILESYEHWPKLKKQLEREPARRRVHFVDHPVSACPKCSIKLLHHEEIELQRRGVTEASCHGFILSRNG